MKEIEKTLRREIDETIKAISDCFKYLDKDDTDTVEAILIQTQSELKDAVETHDTILGLRKERYEEFDTEGEGYGDTDE